jgi:uncharacterized protein (DUF305 family)
MKSKISVFIALCTFTYFIIGCNDNKTSAEKDKNDTAISQGTNVSMDTMQHMDNMQMNMDNGLMASMNSTMNGMKNMKMTGDFDIDFANMMVAHHQGAIDMSEKEVSAGKDEKIKRMAQEIINSQKEEIQKLNKFLKNYKPSGMKHGEGTLQKSMTGMYEKMKAMHMSGDIDKDYASMMIAHHEGAVDMAKKQLSNGMSSKLKQTAQKTIDDQTKEIKEFKNWLESKQ